MDLLQLRYFYESAKTENFTKVAAKYRVPASSVSASIKRLEQEVGRSLFDRTSNKIQLNESGKKFMHSLGIIFDELDHAMDSLVSPNTEDTREIRVAICALRNIVTNCIIEYQLRNPNVSFKTTVGNIDAPENFDIIIDESSKCYSGFHQSELCRAQILLKASTKHPLYGKKLTMHQLRNQPFISMGTQGNLHNILLSGCKKAGFTPSIAVECNDHRCYWNFVKAGIGIGIGRKTQYADSNPEIGILNISDFNEHQVISCYYKSHADYGNINSFLTFLNNRDIQSMFCETNL